jgi:hypothetical protein
VSIMEIVKYTIFLLTEIHVMSHPSAVLCSHLFMQVIFVSVGVQALCACMNVHA